jgi:hypothetical protein
MNIQYSVMIVRSRRLLFTRNVAGGGNRSCMQYFGGETSSEVITWLNKEGVGRMILKWTLGKVAVGW